MSGVRVRGEDGELVGDESELNQIWKGYFEEFMNKETEARLASAQPRIVRKARSAILHNHRRTVSI